MSSMGADGRAARPLAAAAFAGDAGVCAVSATAPRTHAAMTVKRPLISAYSGTTPTLRQAGQATAVVAMVLNTAQTVRHAVVLLLAAWLFPDPGRTPPDGGARLVAHLLSSARDRFRRHRIVCPAATPVL